MKHSPGPANRPGGRPGFSLVEVTLALVLVAGLLLTALNVVGASVSTRVRADERAFAGLLAQDLVAEALAEPYDDPDGNRFASLFGPGWGPEAGEAARGDRRGFDDVDDYDGWSASPPTDAEGVAIPRSDGLTRSVIVRYAVAADPSIEAGVDEGLKRVVVQVLRGERLLGEAVGLTHRAAPGGGS